MSRTADRQPVSLDLGAGNALYTDQIQTNGAVA
jgi:hypothetical protein